MSDTSKEVYTEISDLFDLFKTEAETWVSSDDLEAVAMARRYDKQLIKALKDFVRKSILESKELEYQAYLASLETETITEETTTEEAVETESSETESSEETTEASN